MQTCAAAAVEDMRREEYRCWSNPEGQALQQVTDNVWSIGRPFYPPILPGKVDVGGRAAVVRLSDGTLWVHSPLQLDETLKEALAKIGEVRHIVSPNFEHVSFAPAWLKAYPKAKGYGCPGLKAKMPDAGFAEDLSTDNQSPPEWKGEIEHTFLGYEYNPFTGKPFFNEVVFCYKPEGMFFATDFYWAYPSSGTQAATQAFKFGMDRIYGPFYRSLMIKDRGLFDQTMKRIFGDWSWDKIFPCHGNPVMANGKPVLKEHLKLRNAPSGSL